MPGIERRLFPRFEVEDQVRVQLEPPSWPVHLIDVSAGGFSAASPESFPVDRLLEFRFLDRDGTWSTVLTARVVYSHRTKTPERYPVEYITGFSFVVTPLVRSTRRIDDLLDRVPLRTFLTIE